VEQLLNEHQAARMLGISVNSLRNWRCSRTGPKYYKVGRSVRYHPDDLREFCRPIEPRQELAAGARA